MQKDEKWYNGYSNYETWNFNMICNNEYRFYHHVRDIVTNNIDDKETVIGCLKSLASAVIPDDYYNVNFNDIADTWIYDIKEELKSSDNWHS